MKKLTAMLIALGIMFSPITLCTCRASEPVVAENNQQAIEVNLENYTISNDKSLLQFDRIKEFHQQMYWTKNWPDEKIQKNIDNSTLCYGAYDESGVQVGFVRVVTDFSTVAYILDTVIDEAFRGKGIGTKLMKTVLENEDLNDCSFVLVTSVQAKKFYESLGFQIKNEKYMLCRVS